MPTLYIYYIYLASILFSAVVAFTFRKSIRTRGLIILVPYLFYVFIQEGGLLLLNRFKILLVNDIVYTFYRPLTVFIFGALYYFIPFMLPVRKIIIWIVSIYVIANIIIFVSIGSIFETNAYLILIRGFAITVIAVLFLFRYFYLDNQKDEEFWRPLIWITIAVLIFYPVVSISISFQKSLQALNATIAGYNLYNIIPQLLSIFMYSCFSYAFYLCHKTK